VDLQTGWLAMMMILAGKGVFLFVAD